MVKRRIRLGDNVAVAFLLRAMHVDIDATYEVGRLQEWFLEEHPGYSKRTINSSLDGLKRQGIVINVGRGLWRLSSSERNRCRPGGPGPISEGELSVLFHERKS